MNRQMRRATERSEKRQDERLNKLSSRPTTKTNHKKAKKKSLKPAQATTATPADPMRQMPNWLMGTLALVALVVVVIPQGLPPADTVNNTPPLYYVSHMMAFAIFPYFFCTWLIRRGTANAVLLTAFMVVPLAFGVEIGKLMQLNQDIWRSAIFVPLALLGAAGGIWLAQAVEKARASMANDIQDA